VLSSHLLDEVEKTCDHVAIVDGGTIVAQGSIDELRGDGQVVFVDTDDRERARGVLAASSAVERIVEDGAVLAVSVVDPHVVPELNRRLVEAGVAVRRLEPQQASLEQRFLEITTRLENAA
jgi:ABC-2 type transport system ATP-binding protein